MSPFAVSLVVAVVFAGFVIWTNGGMARAKSTRFALELLDACLFGYVAYLGLNLLFNFSAFFSWTHVLRILFFVPPMSSVQTLASLAGMAVVVVRFRQGPGTDYKNKHDQAGGRRIICHRAALQLANALLARRTAAKNQELAAKGKSLLNRPQHMDPNAHYDKPDDEELIRMLPLEDVETNGALVPYVAEPDEFATIAWGGIRLPAEEARKHCLVVGGTGSGKTLLIHALMRSVLPQITRAQDFRAFIYDDKLDFLPFAREIGIEQYVWNLDPYNEDGLAWDIAADADSQEAARQVAEALAPVESQHQPYFDTAAQQLIAAALIRLGERCGSNWTLRDVLLACVDRKVLGDLLEGSKDVFVLRATKNLTSPRDSTADVMGTISQKLSPYAPVAALWSTAKKKVSIKDWHRTNAILLLVMRQGCSVALQPINQALFRLASSHLVDDVRTDRQSWMFLDEVREIGRLRGLTALTNKGRDKGVRVVMGFQTIEGLQVAWGGKEAGSEAANICANRIYLHSDSPDTCQWMAQHVGAIEVEETIFQQSLSKERPGHTDGGSWDQKRNTRSTMHASDFGENLKSASPEDGLTALNIIPVIGTYVSWMPWSWVLKHLPKPENFEEKVRTPEQQRLRDWNEDDFDRLKFHPSASSEKPTKRQDNPVEEKGSDNLKAEKLKRLHNTKIQKPHR